MRHSVQDSAIAIYVAVQCFLINTLAMYTGVCMNLGAMYMGRCMARLNGHAILVARGRP